MSVTIRELLEGIAILSAMIAVIAIPNPAEAAEPGDFMASHMQCRESGPFQFPGFCIVKTRPVIQRSK